MRTVSCIEMLKFVSENGSSEPEIDHSIKGCVSEDYWDKGRDNIIACIRYFDDGSVLHYINEEVDNLENKHE